MRTLLSAVAVMLFTASLTQASTLFSATLTGDQEVPPAVTDASGSATLELNANQDRLTISIQLNNLDLDGNQTPNDSSDNVTSMHIHAAPAGINGGVVFGFISPNSDTNADLVIDPVAGTVVSAWDLNEGNGTTLNAQLTNLFNDGLYINVHTVGFPAGEVRGQIIPEPATASLLLLTMPWVLRRKTQ